jgi:hypothetical protein
VLELAQSIVGAAVDLDHVQPVLEERDRRQEVLTLQSVRIKIIGPVVRGRDEHNPMTEQRAEQPSEDHGVGDVGNVKFVEAHQAKPPSDAGSDRQQRVFLVLERLKLFMDPAHERVEMHPRLAPQRHCRIETVHQKALAPSHATPEVHAARRRRRLEPTQQRLARLLERDELVVQELQPLKRRLLRAVEDDTATNEARLEIVKQRTVSCAAGRRIIHVASPGWRMVHVRC